MLLEVTLPSVSRAQVENYEGNSLQGPHGRSGPQALIGLFSLWASLRLLIAGGRLYNYLCRRLCKQALIHALMLSLRARSLRKDLGMRRWSCLATSALLY